jgi:pimeloyl-ACP methyl ester carboxylesterase
MPHAQVGGQRLYYEDIGSGDDVIVFSHGLYMDHSMFEPQVEAVRERWRCITWDERAHGATQSTDEQFDYWDMAGVTSASSERSLRACPRAASCRCERR